MITLIFFLSGINVASIYQRANLQHVRPRVLFGASQKCAMFPNAAPFIYSDILRFFNVQFSSNAI